MNDAAPGEARVLEPLGHFVIGTHAMHDDRQGEFACHAQLGLEQLPLGVMIGQSRIEAAFAQRDDLASMLIEGLMKRRQRALAMLGQKIGMQPQGTEDTRG